MAESQPLDVEQLCCTRGEAATTKQKEPSLWNRFLAWTSFRNLPMGVHVVQHCKRQNLPCAIICSLSVLLDSFVTSGCISPPLGPMNAFLISKGGFLEGRSANDHLVLTYMIGKSLYMFRAKKEFHPGLAGLYQRGSIEGL